jgi:hypothetical protein
MDKFVRLEYAYGVCPKCKRVHYLRYLIHNDGLIHKPYEIKCINCNSYFAKEDILGSGEETAPKPITNADCIRAMSDEELARFLGSIIHDWCQGGAVILMGASEVYVDSWLDWLRQEAKE